VAGLKVTGTGAMRMKTIINLYLRSIQLLLPILLLAGYSSAARSQSYAQLGLVDPIVGTWQIEIFGGAAASNCNFSADGGLVNQDNATLGSIPNILGNQSAFGTTSFGQWRKIGHHVYQAFFSNLVATNDGTNYPLFGRLPVTATLTMNAAHDKMTASTSAVLYTNPTDATFTGPHGSPLPGPATFYKTTFATFGLKP
jgi:hypothetical protein